MNILIFNPLSPGISARSRPAYKKAKQDTKRYSVQLHQYDVKWTIDNNVIK